MCVGRCASDCGGLCFHPQLRRPQPSTGIPKWRSGLCAPCAVRGGQPSSHQQPPPFPAPGARHRASPSPLSSLLDLLGSKLSPRQSQHLAACPGPAWPPRTTGAGDSYLRPRALQSHRLQPVSTVGPRSSARPPRQPLLALPLPGKPPPPPSRQPTSTVHMACLSQWATSPFRSPSRVPSPLPGRGSERGAGVSTELLLLKSDPWGDGGGGKESHRVPPVGILLRDRHT